MRNRCWNPSTDILPQSTRNKQGSQEIPRAPPTFDISILMIHRVVSPGPSEHWHLQRAVSLKLDPTRQQQNEKIWVSLLSHLEKNHHLNSDLQFLICNTERPGQMLSEFSGRSSLSQRIEEPSYVCVDLSDDVGDIMGTFSSVSWGVSIKDSPKQSGAVFYGLQVAISGSHQGPERLVLESWIFCQPNWSAKNLPFIRPLPVSGVAFPCTAEVWFPLATPATAVKENHIYNGLSRSEVTTTYGFRSHRQLTLCIPPSC